MVLSRGSEDALVWRESAVGQDLSFVSVMLMVLSQLSMMIDGPITSMLGRQRRG